MSILYLDKQYYCLIDIPVFSQYIAKKVHIVWLDRHRALLLIGNYAYNHRLIHTLDKEEQKNDIMCLLFFQASEQKGKLSSIIKNLDLCY